MMIPPGLSGPYCQPLPWLPPIAPVAAPIGTLTLSNPSEDSFEMEGHEEGAHSEGSHGGGHDEGHGGHSSSRFGAALEAIKKHGPLALLVGAGTLLTNLIPNFKMSWANSAKFAAANMAMVLLLTGGIAAVKASGHGSGGHGGGH